MALSKEAALASAREAAPTLRELWSIGAFVPQGSWNAWSSLADVDFFQATECAALRIAAPLKELAQDAGQTVTDLAAMLMGGQETAEGKAGSSCSCQGLMQLFPLRTLAGLTELAEDAAEAKCGNMWLPGMMLLLATPSMGPIVVCGLVLPTKVVYGTVSVVMAVAGWSVLKRHPEEIDRRMQKRAFAALMLCSINHLAMAFLGGMPGPVAAYFAYPDIAFHFLEDFIVSPLLIINLGHLAGVPAYEMLPCIACSLLGTVGSLGAAVAPTQIHRMVFLLSGFSFMGLAAVMVNQLPAQAWMLSIRNKMRCQVAGDLLLFTWTLYPLVQGLGLLGAASVPSQLHAFAVLDLLSKLGVCHVMLRSRSALQSATQVAGRGDEEPCSEPLPHNPEGGH